MHRIVIALGLTAITTSATAADMPLKAPPRLAPVFSWTGCYIGGYVGGAWNGGDGAVFTDQGQNGLGPAGSTRGFLSYSGGAGASRLVPPHFVERRPGLQFHWRRHSRLQLAARRLALRARN